MSSPAPRDSEHHARVGALFAAVCDLASRERAAHLAAACADDPVLLRDVEELLEFEARDTDFLKGRAPLQLPTEAAPEPGPGDQLGDYRLVRLIGTGGMGRVFEAEQRAPRRFVALKLLTSEFATPGVLKRFEREGEVLARLKHPSIAQIYSVETDTAQGAVRPFFTMELVEGPPITEYADAHDLGWRERLELVSAVCDAVEHAHQRGVIHRDLKPANILVAGDGVPKVLDFGVARLTDADLCSATLDTHVGQIIGTLAAMSPEQASGDPNEIDTRSDVYSLGVLLYELLTGRLPYDLDGQSLPEALRTIQEHEPARLRRATDTSTGMFDADVATVVAKALEKDKERRYSSAHALGEDLRRVLRSEPIVARPATTLYQLKKFAQRNRILVISSMLVFLVVSVGFAASSVLYVKAEDARVDTELALARALDSEREASASAEQARNAEALARTAEAQAREEAVAASRTADLMINIFDLNLPEQARGETITAREILDGASERLAVELRDQPRIRARLSNALGQVYLNLGLYDSSRAHYEEALELREAEYGPTAEPTLETVGDLAVVLWRLGEYEQAKAYHLRAIAGLETLLGPDDIEIANRLNSLGALLGGIGDWDGAFDAFTRAVEIRDRNPESDPLETAQIVQNLGIVQGRLGRPEEAEQTLRRVLEVRREFGGENDPELALVLGSLANLLADSGDLEAAVELYVEALAISEKVHGPEHPTVSSDLGNLATGLIQLERFDEAGPLLERALRITERAVGTREHRRYAMQLLNLATVRAGQGDPATALDMNAEARATFVAKLGPDHPYVAECDRVRPYWEAELAELEREGDSAP